MRSIIPTLLLSCAFILQHASPLLAEPEAVIGQFQQETVVPPPISVPVRTTYISPHDPVRVKLLHGVEGKDACIQNCPILCVRMNERREREIIPCPMGEAWTISVEPSSSESYNDSD